MKSMENKFIFEPVEGWGKANNRMFLRTRGRGMPAMFADDKERLCLSFGLRSLDTGF